MEQTPTTNKKCVWLMRHEPKPEQIANLAERGYEVIWDTNLAAQPFQSGADAYQRAKQINGGVAPELVVGVIPMSMIPEFIKLAGDQTILIRAMMRPVSRPIDENGKSMPSEYEWTGLWERIVEVVLKTESW